jgi:hypothetical protein
MLKESGTPIPEEERARQLLTSVVDLIRQHINAQRDIYNQETNTSIKKWIADRQDVGIYLIGVLDELLTNPFAKSNKAYFYFYINSIDTSDGDPVPYILNEKFKNLSLVTRNMIHDANAEAYLDKNATNYHTRRYVHHFDEQGIQVLHHTGAELTGDDQLRFGSIAKKIGLYSFLQAMSVIPHYQAHPNREIFQLLAKDITQEIIDLDDDYYPIDELQKMAGLLAGSIIEIENIDSLSPSDKCAYIVKSFPGISRLSLSYALAPQDLAEDKRLQYTSNIISQLKTANVPIVSSIDKETRRVRYSFSGTENHKIAFTKDSIDSLHEKLSEPLDEISIEELSKPPKALFVDFDPEKLCNLDQEGLAQEFGISLDTLDKVETMAREILSTSSSTYFVDDISAGRLVAAGFSPTISGAKRLALEMMGPEGKAFERTLLRQYLYKIGYRFIVEKQTQGRVGESIKCLRTVAFEPTSTVFAKAKDHLKITLTQAGDILTNPDKNSYLQLIRDPKFKEIISKYKRLKDRREYPTPFLRYKQRVSLLDDTQMLEGHSETVLTGMVLLMDALDRLLEKGWYKSPPTGNSNYEFLDELASNLATFGCDIPDFNPRYESGYVHTPGIASIARLLMK